MKSFKKKKLGSLNNICDRAIGFLQLLYLWWMYVYVNHWSFFHSHLSEYFLVKKILNHNKILYLLAIDRLTLIEDDQAMIYLILRACFVIFRPLRWIGKFTNIVATYSRNWKRAVTFDLPIFGLLFQLFAESTSCIISFTLPEVLKFSRTLNQVPLRIVWIVLFSSSI